MAYLDLEETRKQWVVKYKMMQDIIDGEKGNSTPMADLARAVKVEIDLGRSMASNQDYLTKVIAQKDAKLDEVGQQLLNARARAAPPLRPSLV